MSDKILMENWRKFLNERSLSDLKDEMGAAAAMAAAGEEVNPIPKTPIIRRDGREEPEILEPLECKGTVGEYKAELLKLARADKLGAASAKGGIAVIKTIIGGALEAIEAAGEGAEAVASGGEIVAEISTDALADASAAMADADLDTDFSPEDKREVPMLEFVTIDDRYKALFRESVIQEFLTEFRRTSFAGLDDGDQMPDIDELFEDWIAKKYEGIKVDGVSSARVDYLGWCKPDESPTAHTMGKKHAARITGNVWDRMKRIAKTSPKVARAILNRVKSLLAEKGTIDAEALAEVMTQIEKEILVD